MTRLDLLPENDLVTSLKKALTDIDQLKQQQFIGSDSLRPQIISTNKVYDFQAELDTLNPIPPYYYVNLELVFEANNQLNPYARPFVELFTTGGAPFPFSSLDMYNIAELNENTLMPFVDDKTTAMQLIVRSSTQFRLKLYMQASDKGTVYGTVFIGSQAP